MERKYAIVDIETTGGLVKRDKITEIAIVLHDGRNVIDQYQTLINPERSIPAYISSMTGITDNMVADAPLFCEVAKEIVLRTEGAVFVAHNARFDYGFLREEFARLGYAYTRKQLCTVRLSRKLLPQLKSHSLDSLIRHYALHVDNRHRALDDALATAEVFRRMTGMHESVAEVSDLINMGIKEARLPTSISLEKLHQLPETAGVYYFHDNEGKVIYVGKSIHIKKRVIQHFAEISNKSGKMQQRVHDITCEVTGSELIASLLENAEIKRLQPEINRAQRRKSFPFAIYYYFDEGGYIQMKVRKKNKIDAPGTAAILHELPDQYAATNYLRSLTDKYSLCMKKTDIDTGPGSCFYHQVGKCAGACLGLEIPDQYNLRVRQAVAETQKNLDEDYVIADQGRQPGESSLVLVSKGRVMGWGYVDQEHSITSIGDVIDHINVRHSLPEDSKFVKSYMRAGKFEKMILL
ncbi:MAG TPA: exonuclease domain-containing protein [Saprospiraceae bacterium]|nr:exonuclease domain-containing protein [Saprospiraceae bacterium]